MRTRLMRKITGVDYFNSFCVLDGHVLNVFGIKGTSGTEFIKLPADIAGEYRLEWPVFTSADIELMFDKILTDHTCFYMMCGIKTHNNLYRKLKLDDYSKLLD